jgi:hypothetical protein
MKVAHIRHLSANVGLALASNFETLKPAKPVKR